MNNQPLVKGGQGRTDAETRHAGLVASVLLVAFWAALVAWRIMQ